MTAADVERARTWMLEIAAAAVPGVETIDEGPERRFRCNGGLLINRTTGAWYCHAAGRGGYAPIGLVQCIKSFSKEQATTWVSAFLANHPGTGGATGATEDGSGYASGEANRLRAEELLEAAIGVEGTPGEAYLRGRGIEPPYPATVRFVADARVGEGALIGRLTAHDRVVGVQLLYLDPDGRKSLVLPTRRRFGLEKSPGAGFLLNGPSTGPTLICEGLEDALSLAMLGIGPVIGLPGIAALRHLELPKGTEVVVVRDGDETGSPADKGLIAGVDHLLLEGSTVKVTETPAGADANSILQSGGGTEALRQLIADAHTAELSLRGDITRLAKLDRLEYAGERKLTAKKHGIPVGTLDDEVKDEKGRQSAGVTDDAPSQDEPAWDGPVPILADVLDAAHNEVSRYIVASTPKHATAVLWSAHTHLVHNERVCLQISPRLAIQAPVPGAGKTTLLEIIRELSFRGTVKSGVTGSSMMRTMAASKRTYCLDEADRQINDRSSDLLISILNSGNRRSTAKVECSVPTADGGWKVGEFDTWGAVAFSGIGELLPTLQDRSIRIPLQRATGVEVPEHLRNGSSPALMIIRRQLSAWADGLFELPEPELPALLTHQAGRVGDNWRPLIAIADLAGGQWPKLARQAAMEEATAEKRQTRLERLLAAIRRAFDGQSDTLPDDAPDTRDRLRSKTLISALLADSEDDWGTANRGRVITEAWLRERLRGLLDPAGSQQWHHGAPRMHANGYLRLQFLDAWRRYTPDDKTPFSSPSPDPVHPVHAVHPVHTAENPQNSAGLGDEAAVPDAPAGESIRSSNNTQKSQAFCRGVPDEPDVPDVPDAEGGRENGKSPGKRSTKETTGGSAAPPPWDDAADLGAVIRAARTADPGLSIRSIAKSVGQPEDVVRRYLGGSA